MSTKLIYIRFIAQSLFSFQNLQNKKNQCKTRQMNKLLSINLIINYCHTIVILKLCHHYSHCLLALTRVHRTPPRWHLWGSQHGQSCCLSGPARHPLLLSLLLLQSLPPQECLQNKTIINITTTYVYCTDNYILNIKVWVAHFL